MSARGKAFKKRFGKKPGLASTYGRDESAQQSQFAQTYNASMQLQGAINREAEHIILGALKRENTNFNPLWPEEQYRNTADRSRQSDSDELRKEVPNDRKSHQGHSDTTSEQASRSDCT